jgi:hypothetical protein
MEAARVLVVDDEKSILLLLEEALTQWGYQVTCAGTVAEGLEALRTGLYDAAITDIRRALEQEPAYTLWYPFPRQVIPTTSLGTTIDYIAFQIYLCPSDPSPTMNVRISPIVVFRRSIALSTRDDASPASSVMSSGPSSNDRATA